MWHLSVLIRRTYKTKSGYSTKYRMKHVRTVILYTVQKFAVHLLKLSCHTLLYNFTGFPNSAGDGHKHTFETCANWHFASCDIFNLVRVTVDSFAYCRNVRLTSVHIDLWAPYQIYPDMWPYSRDAHRPNISTSSDTCPYRDVTLLYKASYGRCL